MALVLHLKGNGRKNYLKIRLHFKKKTLLVNWSDTESIPGLVAPVEELVLAGVEGEGLHHVGPGPQEVPAGVNTGVYKKTKNIYRYIYYKIIFYHDKHVYVF